MFRFWLLTLFAYSIGCTMSDPEDLPVSNNAAFHDATAGTVRVRVFAENNAFFICDASLDPFETTPTITTAETKRGWVRNRNSITYFTRAESNDHRLDIGLTNRYEDNPAAQRVFAHNLYLPSGILSVRDDFHIRVGAGEFTVYLRVFNLDEDIPFAIELDDEEFLRHGEWERYEIILVPGTTDAEGELTS